MPGQIDELVQKITISADERVLDSIQKKEQGLINTSKKLDSSLKSAFKWIGGTLLAKSIFNATMELDSLTRSFNAMAGSSQAGAEELAYLRAEAERLGQSFPSIAQAYKGLFATGVGANMDKGVIRGVFSGLLEASAVLGTSEQETQGAIIALQQMVSKGKVMAQELRLQLGNALPGAFQLAAKAMGVSTSELEKMVEKGLDAKDFVQKFGEELHRQFGGEKLQQSLHSIRAEFTRLKNAIFDTKTGVLAGDTGKVIAQLIRQITDFIKSSGFKAFLSFVSATMSFIVKNIRLILYFKLLSRLIKFTKQFWLLKTFAKAFTKEMALSNSFSLAMKAGFLKSLAVFLRLTKASLLFAKNIAVALGILLLAEDLIASLFPGTKTTTKRAGKSLAESDNVLSRGLRKGVGNLVDLFQKPNFSPKLEDVPLKDKELIEKYRTSSNITINQNIATGASPDDIAEKTKEALTGVFKQYNYGGAK